MGACVACGADNRAGATFCSACGSTLTSACPACGAVPREGARFCDSCGTSLAAAAAPSRKVVTVLFTDLSGSTRAQEQMDPEPVRRWMEHVYATLRAQVEAHGGRVVKFMGDGMMAIWGVPNVHEDDARRALAAAVSMQEAVDDLRATDLKSVV